jgi:hypothetical protein
MQLQGLNFLRPAAGLRLSVERKRYGKKMIGKKWTVFFCPIIFLPQNCLLLKRGADSARRDF